MEEERSKRAESDTLHTEAPVGKWLRKAEAATALGVSARAIERYAKDGKLSVHYEPGRTRPVAIYSREEVEAIAAIQRVNRTIKEDQYSDIDRTRHNVTLPLDSFYWSRLQERARVRGVTPAEYATRLLMVSLDDQQEELLEDLRNDLMALRQNLAVATEGVLVALGSGEAISLEHAHAWVEDNLGSRSEDVKADMDVF